MSYEDIKNAVSLNAEDEENGETTNPIDPENPTPEISEEPDNPDELPNEPDEPEEDNRENWTYKDIVDFYDRVRIALNAVSEATLPDKYMDYPEKAPFAEAYIKGRMPHWMELSDTKFAIFESIIVYQTAVLFQSIIASRHIKKKEIPTIKLEYTDKYVDLIGDMSLADMVEYLLAQLEDEEDKEKVFSGFRVTDANNGKMRCRCGCKNFFH